MYKELLCHPANVEVPTGHHVSEARGCEGASYQGVAVWLESKDYGDICRLVHEDRLSELKDGWQLPKTQGIVDRKAWNHERAQLIWEPVGGQHGMHVSMC